METLAYFLSTVLLLALIFPMATPLLLRRLQRLNAVYRWDAWSPPPSPGRQGFTKASSSISPLEQGKENEYPFFPSGPVPDSVTVRRRRKTALPESSPPGPPPHARALFHASPGALAPAATGTSDEDSDDSSIVDLTQRDSPLALAPESPPKSTEDPSGHPQAPATPGPPMTTAPPRTPARSFAIFEVSDDSSEDGSAVASGSHRPSMAHQAQDKSGTQAAQAPPVPPRTPANAFRVYRESRSSESDGSSDDAEALVSDGTDGGRSDSASPPRGSKKGGGKGRGSSRGSSSRGGPGASIRAPGPPEPPPAGLAPPPPQTPLQFRRGRGESAASLLELFDGAAFDGRLGGQVEVKWSNTLRSTAGQCRMLTVRHPPGGPGEAGRVERRAVVELASKVRPTRLQMPREFEKSKWAA